MIPLRRLQPLLWRERRSGTRIERAWVCKGRVERARVCKGRGARTQEEGREGRGSKGWGPWTHRVSEASSLLVRLLQIVLGFCMDSTSILMALICDSLEITQFSDIFNVLWCNFSQSINMNLKQFLLLFPSPSYLQLWFFSFILFLPCPPPLILIYLSQIKDHSYLRRLTQDRNCSLGYLLIIGPKSGDSLCCSFLLGRLPPPHPTSGS